MGRPRANEWDTFVGGAVLNAPKPERADHRSPLRPDHLRSAHNRSVELVRCSKLDCRARRQPCRRARMPRLPWANIFLR